MKKSIFAVCDLEASYACNLSEYMNERKNTPFEVQAFTNLESLGKFTENNHIELLLISTEAMCDAVKDMDIERIIILSDGEAVENLEENPCVYKYQSSDSLVAEVMNFYARTKPSLNTMFFCGSKVKVIGVYSPLNRVGKTMFALTLGEILGEREKVLYLNLEDYNGFETIFSTSYRSDLSDLIYFARQKEGNLIYKLNGMIQTFRNLDYIPPAFSPGDLRDVGCEEWLSFLGEITSCGEYDVLILDIGTQIEDLLQLLQACTKIYMPVLEDHISRAKLLQFEKNVNALEYSGIFEKIQRLHLPGWRDRRKEGNLLEGLVLGELGSYVRRLLETGEEKADEE
ncbi:MAG: hypothetical protein Q4E91_03260 [Lachnospiraceae bacterium]|nr:hypothetical protein [Lachnospiraceae bacterium]